MCDMTGYDLMFESNGDINIVPHFCRYIECGGGMSKERAKQLKEEYEQRTDGKTVRNSRGTEHR